MLLKKIKWFAVQINRADRAKNRTKIAVQTSNDVSAVQIGLDITVIHAQII